MADREYRASGGGSPEAAPGGGGDERGERAGYDPKSGEVHGSGSGAGPGGNPAEDYDGDPMAGGSREPVGDARSAEEATQRPIDADEGI
jgi:hypothetical protein